MAHGCRGRRRRRSAGGDERACGARCRAGRGVPSEVGVRGVPPGVPAQGLHGRGRSASGDDHRRRSGPGSGLARSARTAEVRTRSASPSGQRPSCVAAAAFSRSRCAEGGVATRGRAAACTAARVRPRSTGKARRGSGRASWLGVDKKQSNAQPASVFSADGPGMAPSQAPEGGRRARVSAILVSGSALPWARKGVRAGGSAEGINRALRGRARRSAPWAGAWPRAWRWKTGGARAETHDSRLEEAGKKTGRHALHIASCRGRAASRGRSSA